MRVFQNASLYPSYVRRLQALAGPSAGFADYRRAMLDDMYGALHLLGPVIECDPEAFLANGHDEASQRAWATEHGMPRQSKLDDILLAQIEDHRTEVFYNLDPITFPGAFARRLPGGVKASIAWRAAPSGSTDFRGYDCMVCNFPAILRTFESSGMQTAMLWPAFDPRMGRFIANTDRPIDVAFVGSFSRHHLKRTAILKMVAALAPRLNVALHLETSSFTRLAEFPLWRACVPAHYKRPPEVLRVARGPVFGQDLYELMARSKIVINTSIDMAGTERGNIRCFEALATGALLLTDEGQYPPGMADGETICIYREPQEIASSVHALLEDSDGLAALAANGSRMLQTRYSKDAQWKALLHIAANVRARPLRQHNASATSP